MSLWASFSHVFLPKSQTTPKQQMSRDRKLSGMLTYFICFCRLQNFKGIEIKSFSKKQVQFKQLDVKYIFLTL